MSCFITRVSGSICSHDRLSARTCNGDSAAVTIRARREHREILKFSSNGFGLRRIAVRPTTRTLAAFQCDILLIEFVCLLDNSRPRTISVAEFRILFSCRLVFIDCQISVALESLKRITRSGLMHLSDEPLDCRTLRTVRATGS